MKGMVLVTYLQKAGVWTKPLVLTLVLVWLTYSMCANAGIYTTAVQSSIAVCIGQIVPSLYGFLILTGLLVKSNLHSVIGKLFHPIARFIFRMTDAEFCVFLVSQLAGYPVGIQMLKTMCEEKKLSEADAGRMSLFCFGAGPAFLLSVFSAGVYGDVRPGLLVWGTATFCNLLLAFFLRRQSPIPNERPRSAPVCFSMNALVGAAESAARALFRMCCLIVAFSIFSKALRLCGAQDAAVAFLAHLGLPQPLAEACFLSSFEISRIAGFPTQREWLSFGAALLSFGSVCVWAQMIALGGKWFCKWRFLLCRFLCAFFCGILCRFLAVRVLVQESVPVSRMQYRVQVPDRPFLSLLLLFLSFFLLSNKKRLDKRQEKCYTIN